MGNRAKKSVLNIEQSDTIEDKVEIREKWVGLPKLIYLSWFFSLPKKWKNKKVIETINAFVELQLSDFIF